MPSPALQNAAAAVEVVAAAAGLLLAVRVLLRAQELVQVEPGDLQVRPVELQLALAVRLVLEALQELRLQLAVSQALAWALAAAACCFRCCQLLEPVALDPQALALGRALQPLHRHQVVQPLRQRQQPVLQLRHPRALPSLVVAPASQLASLPAPLRLQRLGGSLRPRKWPLHGRGRQSEQRSPG